MTAPVSGLKVTCHETSHWLAASMFHNVSQRFTVMLKSDDSDAIHQNYEVGFCSQEISACYIVFLILPPNPMRVTQVSPRFSALYRPLSSATSNHLIRFECCRLMWNLRCPLHVPWIRSNSGDAFLKWCKWNDRTTEPKHPNGQWRPIQWLPYANIIQVLGLVPVQLGSITGRHGLESISLIGNNLAMKNHHCQYLKHGETWWHI